MTNNTCPFCGVIIYRGIEVCKICEKMMSTEQLSETPETEPQFSPLQPPAPPYVQPPPVRPVYNAQPAANFQPETPRGSYYPPPNSNNSRMPPPRSHSNYDDKVGIWEYLMSLSLTVKLISGFVVLIFAFVIVLKSFMTMDVSVQSAQPPTVVDKNLQSQKRWFSSWFRSNPTGDEILEKFEAVTYAKDKELVANSFSVKGRMDFLPPEFTEAGLSQIKEKGEFQTIQTVPYQDYYNRKSSYSKAAKISDVAPWNLKADFDMSLKVPNKTLMKMVLEPKAATTVIVPKMYVDVGFDGVSSWGFGKIYENGKERIQEQDVKDMNAFGNLSLDGVSMTFLRKMYMQKELTGEETLFNRKFYVVETKDKQGGSSTLYFDVETGLVGKVVDKTRRETYFILNYRMFNGTMFPSKMVYKLEDGEWITIEMNELTPNVPFDDAIFSRLFYQQNN